MPQKCSLQTWAYWNPVQLTVLMITVWMNGDCKALVWCHTTSHPQPPPSQVALGSQTIRSPWQTSLSKPRQLGQLSASIPLSLLPLITVRWLILFSNANPSSCTIAADVVKYCVGAEMNNRALDACAFKHVQVFSCGTCSPLLKIGSEWKGAVA